MSETALATVHPAPDFLSPEKIELIKNMICPGATKDELEVFLHQCRRTGLDPLARQIYGIKRYSKDAGREVLQAQTSVDGFRLVAERSREYEGQTDVLWADENGQWFDVWIHNYAPLAAKCGVFRKGFRQALTAVARFDDYVQTYKDGNPTAMWKKMGPTMIAKCAECLALRKAFPHELSGIYTTEEMMQAEKIDEENDLAAAQRRADQSKSVEVPGAQSAHEPSPNGAEPPPLPAKPKPEPPTTYSSLEGSRTGARRSTRLTPARDANDRPVVRQPEGTVVEGELVPPAGESDELAKAKATRTLKGNTLAELTRANIEYLVTNENTYLKQGAAMERLEDAAACIAACKVVLAYKP